MIVSHKHKFIFLKTHKTAGTSLQIALSKHCGSQDIISRIHKSDKNDLIEAGGKDEQNSDVPFSKYNSRDWFQFLIRGRKQVFTEHNNATYLKRWLGNDIWNGYYKFCFERNPIDKFLSYYFWRTRDVDQSLEEFMRSELANLSDLAIYSIDSEIVADDIFLYEHMDESINQLENRLGFEIDMSSVKAKTGYRKNNVDEDKLSKNQKERIINCFKTETELFYPTLKASL